MEEFSMSVEEALKHKLTATPMKTYANIDIRYLPGSPHLEQSDNGDWIDLYTYEDVMLMPDEFQLINLGVAMKLPEGYEANIVPRSSTFKRYGLIQTNHYAVIDNSYCGNNDIWHMPVLATRAVTIPKGTRLCQFRINKKQPSIIFNEVDDLKTSDRGGFGSTGV